MSTGYGAGSGHLEGKVLILYGALLWAAVFNYFLSFMRDIFPVYELVLVWSIACTVFLLFMSVRNVMVMRFVVSMVLMKVMA